MASAEVERTDPLMSRLGSRRGGDLLAPTVNTPALMGVPPAGSVEGVILDGSGAAVFVPHSSAPSRPDSDC